MCAAIRQELQTIITTPAQPAQLLCLQAASEALHKLVQQLGRAPGALRSAASKWHIPTTPEGHLPASTFFGAPAHAYGLPRAHWWLKVSRHPWLRLHDAQRDWLVTA